MADTTAPAAMPAAEKPKITLLFHQEHVHYTGTFKKDADGKETGEEIVKVYKPGDRGVFTQTEADIIRGLRVAQTVANPGPPKP